MDDLKLYAKNPKQQDSLIEWKPGRQNEDQREEKEA